MNDYRVVLTIPVAFGI